MTDMPNRPAHAKPRDHLWVLAVIAAFALFDVWGAWSQVGDKSGFAVGHIGTGWTLTVIVEAAAGYFLFAWFSAPGERSRRCAMWSAFVTLALSLVGQGASIVAAKAQPPIWLAVFVRDLPVVVLVLIAILIHMRRLDREDAAEAVRQDEKDTQIAALRAELEAARQAPQTQLDALRGDLETAQAALRAAQDEAAQGAQEREILARKLDAANRAKKRATPPRNGRANARAKQEPKDVDARTEALKILSNEPDISGRALGPRVGMSPRWGTLHRDELAAMAADFEETS
jgi:hypothetical protein